MNGQQIYQYEVPVDDQEHSFELTDSPSAVGCRVADKMEFWALRRTGAPVRTRIFRVFGTWQDIPEQWSWTGTAVSPDGTFVWHLHEAVE